MVIGAGSVDIKKIVTRSCVDDVCVLRNRAGRGMLSEVGVRLRGMTVLAMKGIDPRGKQVDVIRTMPDYKRAAEFIGNEARNSWGKAMFDAYICPLPSLQKATGRARKGFAPLAVNGARQMIPVDKNGVMLHGFGSLLDWRFAGLLENKKENCVSISATASISDGRWFSPIELLQTIRLQDGVMTRMTTPINTGTARTWFADTTHGYIMIPPGQNREDVLMYLPGRAFVRTVTDKYVPGEDLFPAHDGQNPVENVLSTRYSGLFGDPPVASRLGRYYLDHCITGLVPEHSDRTGTLQYAARAFYPAAGWGVEVSTPFKKADEPLMHALVAYAPPEWCDRNAANAFCFEFCQNVTAPFDDVWKAFPIRQDIGYNPAGMWELEPNALSHRTSVRSFSMIMKMPKVG